MKEAFPPRPALGVWVRLMKAHSLLLREARRSIGPGMTLPQFVVLVQLARDPRGMTSVQLSRQLLVSAGNLTGIIDRLERERLVLREAHETDRRATLIRLTPTGRRRIERILPRHARDLQAALSTIPGPDLARLRHLLGRLNRTLENGRPGAEPARQQRKETG